MSGASFPLPSEEASLVPKISNQQPPIADLEHRSAISLAIHCKRIFQIGDRRLLIGDLGNQHAWPHRCSFTASGKAEIGKIRFNF